jgi:hypothetical protein
VWSVSFLMLEVIGQRWHRKTVAETEKGTLIVHMIYIVIEEGVGNHRYFKSRLEPHLLYSRPVLTAISFVV